MVLTPLLPSVALPLLACPLLLHAALHDIAARIIPGRSCAALACMGLAVRLDHRQLLAGGIAAAAVFAGAALLWRRGWMGGGDVKLLGACACLVEPGRVGMLLGTVMIAGGALAVAYLVLARLAPPVPPPGKPCSRRHRIARIEHWRARSRRGLPYGVAIAAGAALTMAGG